MKDRQGHEYAELLEFQRQHLAAWKEKLRPEIYKGVVKYCEATNRCAKSADDKHRVFRGQTLICLVLEYPDFNHAYLPIVTTPNWLHAEFIEILEVGQEPKKPETAADLI